MGEGPKLSTALLSFSFSYSELYILYSCQINKPEQKQNFPLKP